MGTPGKDDARIAQMTLAEKASLTSGANFWNTKSIDRLDVPGIMLTDGPHGLRKQGGAADHLGLNASIPATCFPTAAALANSWDRELVHTVGATLGAEAAAEHVSVLLGPGLNIKRNPLAGRNFEYFSEDPLLAGSLAGALVRGIQSRGVAASVKHFAVNSQETHRMSVDEIVDERALHEIYLEGFRIAINEGDAWTVMSAYNRVNGEYANENAHLLDEILRRRWGFDGLVVTDWGGNNDRIAGLRAGNALEMPSTDGVTDREVIRAVESGALDEAVLDARVGELLTLIERTTSAAVEAVDDDAHHELAVEAARRSIVLLKNDDGILPLRSDARRIAVIGDFAAHPRYQGAGSSLVNPTRVDSALDALRTSGLDVIGYEAGFRRMDRKSSGRLRRAVRLAQRADTVLLFLGLDESAEAEGVDRAHMRLAQNQLALVRELTALDVPIIVVLAGGAPVELPFADDVAALVHSSLAGQGGGRAVVDVLTGAVNPSGRLAETFPVRYEDVPSAASFGRTEATSEHREHIYVGYRYFDKVGMPVRFPFGHGLSYTTFEYTALAAGPSSARVTVTNTGDVAGTETVQLYIEAPNLASDVIRAPRELRGFAQVALAPGETMTIEIAYAEHAFHVFDAAAGDWRVIGGDYAVLVGASSRDIRLRYPLAVAGERMPDAVASDLPHYVTGHVANVDADEYAALLGRELPDTNWRADRLLTRDDIVAQTRGRGGFASVLYGLIDGTSRLLMRLGRPLAANNTRFALDLPFRSIARLSGGSVTDDMIDGLLIAVNGRFWRGAKHFIGAWRTHRRTARTRTKKED
ncbi:glycoside hydrolase family 3 C-terminal domain-containing protein [Microbacterium sp. H1-D42]|uniref:glycoside hydrolase family 3 C-terminal domain-containing protein n=1 Tax=Microbacterium sp. H1-D42 TaxID=2925844 RepID=UPI001F52CBE0|nr:glycoside hydrolase family 3 C-terminal domain-containing protein [Microbacterium sp. H1-D42]UNK71847.1 glycoside hydrolase family 3 C-terminal domain-containing protein [Microbacterium sp. H1-D42]